jgi:hypothetical protein
VASAKVEPWEQEHSTEENLYITERTIYSGHRKPTTEDSEQS